MKILILFLILLLPVACLSLEPAEQCEKMWRQILRDYSKQAKKENLTVIGTGGGIEGDRITKINVTFQYNGTLNLDSARQTLIKSVELLEQIVKNQVRYQTCFPLDGWVDKLSIIILAEIPQQESEKVVTSIALNHGRIRYSRRGFGKPINETEVIHKETYQEALRIAQSQI